MPNRTGLKLICPHPGQLAPLLGMRSLCLLVRVGVSRDLHESHICTEQIKWKYTHTHTKPSFGWTVEIREGGGLGLSVLCSCLYIEGVGRGDYNLSMLLYNLS